MTAAAATDLATKRFDSWKRAQLDLSARNRLIHAHDGEQFIMLPSVVPNVLDQWLDADGGCGLAAKVLEAAAPSSQMMLSPALNAVVEIPLSQAVMERRLRVMERAARSSLADIGAQTLWVGFGMLSWRDPAAPSEMLRSPLLLRAVELRRRGTEAGYRLVALDDEYRVNNALIEKLRGDAHLVFERFALPASADSVPRVVDAVIDGVRSELAGLLRAQPERFASWSVEATSCLGIFSSGNFAMWSDLHHDAERFLQNPVVRSLAGDDSIRFASHAELPDAAQLDDVAVGTLFAPLDADRHQLAAVLAAGDDKSFVLQGAPGTGKSQTIANVIAHCLAIGKTVLFVSHKQAALDAVERRLASIGLSDFSLVLHPNKAARRDVIAALGKVVDRTWRPGAGPMGDDAALSAARDHLDAYASALHARPSVHLGLGRSLHELLERIVALGDAPHLPMDIATSKVASRSAAAFEAARVACERYAATASRVFALGPLAEHPWHHCRVSTWHLTTADQVAGALDEMRSSVDAVQSHLAGLRRFVPGLVVTSGDDLRAIESLLSIAVRSPRPGAELVVAAKSPGAIDAHDDGSSHRSQEIPKSPDAYVALAKRQHTIKADLATRWTHGIAEFDASALAERFRRWAGRFPLWRWFALRGARSTVRRALQAGAWPGDRAVARDLELAAEVQRCTALLDAAEAPAQRWFGETRGERGAALDLDRVASAVSWSQELAVAFAKLTIRGDSDARERAWQSLVAEVSANGAARDGGDDSRAAIAAAAAAVARVCAATTVVTATLALDEAAAFEDTHGGHYLETLRARAAAWLEALPQLHDWVDYTHVANAARGAGLDPLVAACEAGTVAPESLLPAWERSILLIAADAQLAGSPALAEFVSAAHAVRLAEFIELDRASLGIARARCIARLFERVPKVDADLDGEFGILLREMKKQRGHLSLRSLFVELPTLLPRIKPCIAMSPTSVAQYLDPAMPLFDLVIFDEASQLAVGDAIGALGRGRTALIVGDTRQLPTEPAGADSESSLALLDEAIAARLPMMRLATHYRSRHEDLIAFANAHFYDDDLLVYPTSDVESAELGVRWRHVTGVLDRTRSRNNRVEAENIVIEVVARLTDPAQRDRSIGIVAFNREQQTLIEDLLDEARGRNAAIERFFTDAVVEPVWIKTLDNVQGEERDVVLFSVGYSADASGTVATDLGAFGRVGGERQLNVAITRARQLLVVYSSVMPEMLRIEGAPRGIVELADFLAYARRGGKASRPEIAATAFNAMSSVLGAALIARGWSVRHQVGCGRDRIELAVIDPSDPGRYVLAVETDGANYAASPVARDRDRLRGQVLGTLGWRQHRVWGLDVCADIDKEGQRLHNAVVAAIAAGRAARRPAFVGANVATTPVATSSTTAGPRKRATTLTPSARVSTGIPVVIAPADSSPTARTSIAKGSGGTPAASSIAVIDYRAVSLPMGRRKPDELFEPKLADELARLIDQVLAAEAPIHLALLARRVGLYFGIARPSAEVVEQVRVAASSAGHLGSEAAVVWRKSEGELPWPSVRIGRADPSTRRDIEEVPLAEIASAVRLAVERNAGIARDDLVRETARILGVQRTGDKILARLNAGVEHAIASGVVRADDAGFVIDLGS